MRGGSASTETIWSRGCGCLSGVVDSACSWSSAAASGSCRSCRASYYRELAENNRLRKLPIKAPRGLIYDRHGRLLVENIPSYNLMLDRSRSRRPGRSLEFAAPGARAAAARAPGARSSATAAIPDFKPVLLAENLTLGAGGPLRRRAASSIPEFEIEVQHLRLYRHGEQTAHVLGYLGEVTARTSSRAAEGLYKPGDLVGKKGDRADLRRRSCAARTASAWWSSTAAASLLEEYGRREAAAGQATSP